jgi:hypothetical protein
MCEPMASDFAGAPAYTACIQNANLLAFARGE